jgi:RNA polymerase sigma-70 factor (ECF subfamily)
VDELADLAARAAVESGAWAQLVELAGPPALLARIERRMSVALGRALTAEDIWQETLLHAWRDRSRYQWRGMPSFRRYLVEIAENRVRDAVDRARSLKRAGELVDQRLDASSSDPGFTAFVSSTPSRHALHREQKELMQRALQAVPELQREVLWRRLFEEQSLEEIAAALALTPAAVKHRLRKGSAIYRERLTALLRTRPSADSAIV